MEYLVNKTNIIIIIIIKFLYINKKFFFFILKNNKDCVRNECKKCFNFEQRK